MYARIKTECESLLMQKDLVGKIQASEARREIMEVSNLMNTLIEDSDKLFQ